MDTQWVIFTTSRRRWQIVVVLAAVLLLNLLLSTFVLASDAQSYSIAWWTIDGGGVTTSTGGYSLGGTIGQPDSGMSGGSNYTLAGGFWFSTFTRHNLNLPLVLR